MDASVIITLCGGLGLFLYGMKYMSDSIEKVAGDKLRSILEMFTKNRFLGMIVGIVFTGIVQSSGACTVMVVSFVNSGLMDLYQAAGVIFGANIGTTVTSQLVSFKLSQYAPIILFVGAVGFMFARSNKIKKFSEVILGFGILFMGLEVMSNAMAGLSEVESVRNILLNVRNPILAIIIGFTMTAIVQSSSVTVSIVVLMAGQGLLELPVCFFIILGCNIGSCTTSMIAALAGKKDAKRASMIHLLFNVIGTIIIGIVFVFAIAPISNAVLNISGGDMGRAVANAHSLIKIVQVIMLFPFSKFIVKLTMIIIPGEEKKIGYRESYQLKYIGDKVVFNPATAVFEVIKEVERMADLAGENINRAMNALITLDEEDISEVYEVEKNINFLNHSITNYLVKINQSTLPIEDLKSIGHLFHVVNDIERVGDHAENFADAAKQRIDTGVSISKEAQLELGTMLDMVNEIYRLSVKTFVSGLDTEVDNISRLEDAIDNKERELQQAHVDRLTRNECTPEAGMIFSDVVSGLERIADHATNIAYSVIKDNN